MMLPGDIFHPGETLKDELVARNLTQKSLATMMGIKPNVLSELIHGKRNFTAELAVKTEKALGIDAEFWMRMQIRYEINLIRKLAKDNIQSSKLNTKQKKALSQVI